MEVGIVLPLEPSPGTKLRRESRCSNVKTPKVTRGQCVQDVQVTSSALTDASLAET